MMQLMTNISVILISGGSGSGEDVELLHTNGSRICSLPDLPSNRHRLGHTQTGVTACGGWDWGSTCHTLSSTGSWEESHNLAHSRRHHSAWASPLGIVLIGGVDRWGSEILLENGITTTGLNLDYQTM